jgi:hypothetical protein
MSRLPPEGYYSEAQQAIRLSKTPRTLRMWRRRGFGPPYVKFGRDIIYRIGADSEFLSKLERSPELPQPRRRMAS